MSTRLARRFVNLTGSTESLRSQLVRGGIGSVLVKAVSMVLSLIVAIILARTLGPEGYGIYAYVFAPISLMVIPVEPGRVGNLLPMRAFLTI